MDLLRILGITHEGESIKPIKPDEILEAQCDIYLQMQPDASVTFKLLDRVAEANYPKTFTLLFSRFTEQHEPSKELFLRHSDTCMKDRFAWIIMPFYRTVFEQMNGNEMLEFIKTQERALRHTFVLYCHRKQPFEYKKDFKPSSLDAGDLNIIKLLYNLPPTELITLAKEDSEKRMWVEMLSKHCI